jgi:WD40 repeat protein
LFISEILPLLLFPFLYFSHFGLVFFFFLLPLSSGSVRSGLHLLPDDRHMIYPLGSTIVVKDLVKGSQSFLRNNGNDNTLSLFFIFFPCFLTLDSLSCRSRSQCELSRSLLLQEAFGFGSSYSHGLCCTHLLLSSVLPHPFCISLLFFFFLLQAIVIVWDLESQQPVHHLNLHKGAVQDVAFSHGDRFIATLGGRDDNKLVIWDAETGEAICGASAANESGLTVRWFNDRDDMLVTGGFYNLRVWQFDLPNRKIRPIDSQLGQLKRVVSSIAIDSKDEYMYCGTKTGDVIQVSLGPKSLFKNAGPKKPWSQGVDCVTSTKQGHVLVGSGDGHVALLDKDSLQVLK